MYDHLIPYSEGIEQYVQYPYFHLLSTTRILL
nr:MAG TPA: hypothetical protein [Caudoviricetes sp.]